VPAAIVKLRTGSPKMAWNKEVVRTKVILEVNFPKYFLADVYRRNCSCAPVLRFSLWRQMAL